MVGAKRPLVSVPLLWPVILVLCVTLSCGGGSPQVEQVPSGTKAPDFALPDLGGKMIPSSDFSGKVVLIDFWATWCGPCRAEIPHLIELYESYQDQGFEIVGIALDNGGADIVGPFVRENAINYPIVIGNREVAMAFGGLTAIPTAFLLDRSGNIVKKYVGYTDKEVFEEEIKKLL